MSIVAVVPARGGSKSVPRKNIRVIGGKPLIAWTIEAALKCRSLGRVITSTDDDEIAQIARQFGAEVPFLRPVDLASDTATSVDVVLHALDWLQQNEHAQPDFVMLLQPTSPLRTAEDIEAAVVLQREKQAEAVVSVCETAHPPQWLKRFGPNGELLPWESGVELEPSRRQEAALAYQQNGAIYLVKTVTLSRARTFLPERTFGYVMPPERSVDIDSPWDFYLAELILKDKCASKAD